MGVAFRHFINQIPEKHTDVKMLATEKVLLLKPHFYIINEVTEIKDYMFVIPSSSPPPIWIGKRENHFRKQKLVVFEPGVSAITKIDAPTREYLNISFNREFFEDIAWEVIKKREVKHKEREFPISPSLMGIISHFEDEMVNYNGDCPLMLQSISVQMIIALLRSTGIYTSGNTREFSQENSYVSKAMEYMRAYFNGGITINDICREINLSPFYFIRIFKSQTGMTPYQFLLEIRMQQAKTVLKQGNYSVEEVARLCGFVNAGHFSSQFRRCVGIVPSEYKKRKSISLP